MGDGPSVVEVFASDVTGTWTITQTLPGGRTCVIAAGRAVEAVSLEADQGLRIGF